MVTPPMKPADFYTVTPGTPTCCSCAHWVATRIYNREAFLCPSDGLGSCCAAPGRNLTPPENSCHSWRPWQADRPAQAASR
jgi:hypothetical protein